MVRARLATATSHGSTQQRCGATVDQGGDYRIDHNVVGAEAKLAFYSQSARHYSSLRFVVVPIYGTALGAIVWSAGALESHQLILQVAAVGVSVMSLLVLGRIGVIVSYYSRLLRDTLKSEEHADPSSRSGLFNKLELNNATDWLFRIVTFVVCVGGAILASLVVAELIPQVGGS